MDEADVQEVFAIVADTVSLLDFLSFGMTLPQFNSVECNEELPFQSFDNTVAIAQSLEIPQMALVVQNMAKQFAVCEVWPSGRAPGFEELPVASDVPTLILAGAYDLQTPVSWNKSAFVNLANGFFVEFPMSGHGVITYSECAEEVAAAFVADPVALPDTSCVAALKPVWVLPESQAKVIATPVS
jgi:pimeloyl-ACP methyl ester carboxylesterase